ncbi:MAG: dTDP-4-dehydrorhamnose 3,5-epimerase [Firmicutes bacterium]|jgi:dTDP-4-dehydrorhamnose 3,5-epimerase|nr:dTDP-4-dehydrorhamnose 3,5-epimerase [Bacillota bacterium]
MQEKNKQTGAQAWSKGQIEGVEIKKLTKHFDRRGFLCETFRLDELPPDLKPVMSYVSYTEPGVARGPHEHREQTDIFAFLGPGNFLLRLWDNRPESPTRGNFMELVAGADNPVTVIIPPGVVHGYRNISATERGMVLNFPNRLYRGWGRKEEVDEIRHEDEKESPFIL